MHMHMHIHMLMHMHMNIHMRMRTRTRTRMGCSTAQRVHVHVQDAPQQYGPSLLRPLPAGTRVLDACAAPGGKMRALLRHQPLLRLLALERGAARAAAMRATLAAGGLTQVGGCGGWAWHNCVACAWRVHHYSRASQRMSTHHAWCRVRRRDCSARAPYRLTTPTTLTLLLRYSYATLTLLLRYSYATPRSPSNSGHHHHHHH
jgi:hypothetical protein